MVTPSAIFMHFPTALIPKNQPDSLRLVGVLNSVAGFFLNQSLRAKLALLRQNALVSIQTRFIRDSFYIPTADSERLSRKNSASS
jgi:hypothetical protein